MGVDGEDGDVLEALDHPPQVLLGAAQHCSTRLRWAISCSSSRRRSSLARARARDSPARASVRTWSSTRATIGSRWLRKLGVLGTKSRTPARSASTSRPSSCMPVTRIAGTLCPAALTWRKNSRPLVPAVSCWSRTIRSIPPPATRPSPSSAVAAVATSYPARSRRNCSSRATPGSSSTSRILARAASGPMRCPRWSVRPAPLARLWPLSGSAPPGGTAPAA